MATGGPTVSGANPRFQFQPPPPEAERLPRYLEQSQSEFAARYNQHTHDPVVDGAGLYVDVASQPTGIGTGDRLPFALTVESGRATATLPYTLTFPEDGLYQLNFTGSADIGSGNDVVIGVYANGVLVPALQGGASTSNQNNFVTFALSGVLDVAANTVADLRNQGPDTILTLLSGQFSMHRLGN